MFFTYLKATTGHVSLKTEHFAFENTKCVCVHIYMFIHVYTHKYNCMQ